jgi:hypothetical protein
VGVIVHLITPTRFSYNLRMAMPRRPKSDVLRKLDKLAADEAAFLATRFVAAVTAGRRVQVRIARVRCELPVEPRDFEGVGVFQPLSHDRARVERVATLAERRAYLSLFVPVRMVLCERSGTSGIGILAGKSDTRFALDAPAPIDLIADDADAGLFDTVVARFDGARFWFDERDPRAELAAGRYLRESILAMRPLVQIDRPGLTAEQREAYRINLDARRRQIERQRQAELAARRASSEGRLAEALEHAGATLREFVEQGGQFRVRYTVDGTEHTSVVARGDLSVLSAGICLSGEDAKFDLASLVSVLREGRDG